MPEQQNIIIIIAGGWAQVCSSLPRLQSIVEDWIGPLSVLSVQNFLTGSVEDHRVEGMITEGWIPTTSRDEIVALYPDDPKLGAVLVFHEGPYDLIILAAGKRGLAVERLKEVWRSIGDNAQAVLVGQELEVEESHITELLHSEMLPSELDLCEAAIVRYSQAEPHAGGLELPFDGRLLMRQERSST